MQQLSEAFRRYQGGTQGSVPVPADAACAQMPPFLASSSARPQAAALRDIRDARVARVRDMRPEQSDPAQPMAVLGIQGRGKQRRKAQRKLH